MTEKQKQRERLRNRLTEVLCGMGYPPEFGAAIAGSLGTEMTMSRMLHYLLHVRPGSPEEIVDEMLAICSDRDRWMEKKKNEYYNRKYSEYLSLDNPKSSTTFSAQRYLS